MHVAGYRKEDIDAAKADVDRATADETRAHLDFSAMTRSLKRTSSPSSSATPPKQIGK